MYYQKYISYFLCGESKVEVHIFILHGCVCVFMCAILNVLQKIFNNRIESHIISHAENQIISLRLIHSYGLADY